MSTPRIGETYVHGVTTELAQQLLAAAEKAGVDESLLRVSDGGFIVPDAVHDQMMLGWASDDAVV